MSQPEDNNSKDVIFYSTFFYFPFKLTNNEHIKKLSDPIKGFGTWKEEHYPLWHGCPDEKECFSSSKWKESGGYQNQELLYFHKYLRQLVFNPVASLNDTFLNYYRLKHNENEVFNEANAKNRVIQIESPKRESHFYLDDAALYFFKNNSIGILSLGVKSDGCTLQEALEFNQLFRILYISDTDQLTDLYKENNPITRIYESISIQNTPLKNTFTHNDHFVIDEGSCLSKNINTIVSGLLPFKYIEEYKPLLDYRMVLHTLFCLNNDLKSNYYDYDDRTKREAYRQLFSRILFADNYNGYIGGYFYDNGFMRRHMRKHLYTRWEQYGTFHGFCRYADATTMFGTYELIPNNFSTVYYMMSIIALYYRCALIDFADQSSSVTKKLVKDWTDKDGAAKKLRMDFLEFSNVWYFRELTNQDQGIEMFGMQRQAYELDELYNGVKEEIEKLNAFVEVEQAKAGFDETKKETKAVNNLTLLGIPLAGIGVLTGFFGMNFEGVFDFLIKKPIYSNDITFSPIIANVLFIILLFLVIISAKYLIPEYKKIRKEIKQNDPERDKAKN